MTRREYDAQCPNCGAGVLMVNCSWAECVSPYCKRPYSVMGIGAVDWAVPA